VEPQPEDTVLLLMHCGNCDMESSFVGAVCEEVDERY